MRSCSSTLQEKTNFAFGSGAAFQAARPERLLLRPRPPFPCENRRSRPGPPGSVRKQPCRLHGRNGED